VNIRRKKEQMEREKKWIFKISLYSFFFFF